ncbi:MAG: DUF1002 domain-containing protein [Chloroflexi bacterium]|nr:DUF1002 domain-containing protein [Chloroflexota bacterium]
MSAEPSDRDLVGRARRGELDAFEELVRRYQGLAVRVAFLITGDLSDAEDVVQDSFVKAHQSLGRVQVDSFRAWLLRIVANEARNTRKAKLRQAAVLSRASGADGGGPSASPEHAVLAEEQRMVLLSAMDGLREEDRLAISYRYFFDLSETEMVEALGWRRGTVKSRLARALVRLRGELGELALLPPVAFALPQVAHELAGWNPAQLEHGLGALAGHFAELPVRDVSAALLAKLQAGVAGAQPRNIWSHVGVQAASVVVVVGIIAAAVLGGSRAQRPQPTPTSAPVVAAASPAAQATPAPSTSIVLFGSDLSEQERSEVSSSLQLPAGTASQTLTREEVLSTLAAANLTSSPDTETLSSVRLTCAPEDRGISVRTNHITMLPALTYATVLLAAGSTDASVVVAAPADRSVTGETALVGLLTASGRCPGNPGSSRVSLGYLVVRTTSELAQAPRDWKSAATIVGDAIHAIVTGQVQDQAGLAAALDSAARDAGTTLDPGLQTQVASELMPLVGQDYGAYARGYRIEAPSANEAQIIPSS